MRLHSNGCIEDGCRMEGNEGHLKRDDFARTLSFFLCHLEFVELRLFLLVEFHNPLDGLPAIHQGHVDIANDKFNRLDIFDVAYLSWLNLV